MIKKLKNLRHLFYAWWGSIKYRHPSEELLVIGVTGTSGKSSTIHFLRQILEAAGHTVGSLSTVDFYVAGKEKLNDQKMTMLGRMQIQKYLRQMVDAGCTVAIIETTSEGFIQHRHRCINYDTIVLTNLYPEHIESHGGFANYKAAKVGIFNYVARCKRKTIAGQSIPKTAIVYAHSEYKREFLSLGFDEKMLFAPEQVECNENGITFSVEQQLFHAPVYGAHQANNIAAAVAVARSLDIDWERLQQAVAELKSPPGRIEFITEAERHGFHVLVDYAFEPVAMGELYKVVESLRPKKIIHVFGSTGGGRDKSRRQTVGKMVGERAMVCIVTDEDPYDDDPEEIIKDVASAVAAAGKEQGKDLFSIVNRRDAIGKAMNLAREGDVVLVTGKGSEQAMVVKGKKIPWDDRVVVRECLKGPKG